MSIAQSSRSTTATPGPLFEVEFITRHSVASLGGNLRIPDSFLTSANGRVEYISAAMDDG